MAKIQKYDIELKFEGRDCLPCIHEKKYNNGEYIKVPELRERYSKIYQELDKELSWKVNSYSRAEILAKKELLEQLLAAIDTEAL